MRNYAVKITGRTALLMHFDNIEAQDAIHARGKTGGKAGDDRYPADTWKTYLYMGEDAVVWPSANILASLLKVGSSISIGGKKTLKASSQSLYFDIALNFEGRKGPIRRADIESIKGDFKTNEEAARDLGFRLLVTPVRVNKNRHVRVRPCFDVWTVEGTFSTDDPDLTTPRLKQLFDLAGLKSGFGDWRPSSPMKPGPYGRFSAEVAEV